MFLAKQIRIVIAGCKWEMKHNTVYESIYSNDPTARDIKQKNELGLLNRQSELMKIKQRKNQIKEIILTITIHIRIVISQTN
jgi:hypothetical protein